MREPKQTGGLRGRSYFGRGWWLGWMLGGLVGGMVPGVAREAPHFGLLDLQGRHHELQRAEGRVVVLFFTGNGCPIARKSAAKLRELRREFGGKGVSFWLVNTYPDDTLAESRREAAELGLWGFTYLRDPRQGVALAYGVERTAEVVAVATGSGKVLYQGAIDDQYAEGTERPKAQERYLHRALSEFLSDQPVTQVRTPARGCRITYAPRLGESGVPSYAEHVAPVLQKHCVPCHREGAIGPFAMDRHGRVRNYAEMIEEVLLTRRMPPWDPDPEHGRFAHATTLSREEMQVLLRWVEAGAPRGEGPDPLTEPLAALPDWPLGEPDVVLRLPQPESIPATGVLPYRHIRLANPFTNEVWVSATDVRPGNRRVVHHAILYARWEGSPDDGSGNGVHFCGWAPGYPPSRFPAGVAKRLPAGAELVLEMHYTTSGSPQTDQTEVALYLAPGPQPREVQVRRADDFDLEIPPGSDEARHSAMYGFQRPATLYALTPHMHVRGKWMRYELLLPDGTRETLLNVPRYDFKWQHSYFLAEPRRVPAGAWLHVTGAFDNSPGNPANPDSTQRVRFGLQSWDEMFIGFFEAADEPEGALSAGVQVLER